jgi:hypothetical protein
MANIKEYQKDLFGKTINPVRDKEKIALKKHDINTFDSRLVRLKYLDSLQTPTSMFGNMEPIYMFDEARLTYLNGAFIATVLLCQAFVEHWLSGYISGKHKNSKTAITLDGMLKQCRKEGLLHEYLIEKIDTLRLVRNPYTHPKSYDYPYSLSKRLIKMYAEPAEIMEQDARNAIEVMHAILLIQY